MRRAFFGRAPAFVVNLGGGDVAVTEQFLHFPNVDAGVEQQVAVVARRECVL
jgi:hypothetical protein